MKLSPILNSIYDAQTLTREHEEAIRAVIGDAKLSIEFHSTVPDGNWRYKRGRNQHAITSLHILIANKGKKAKETGSKTVRGTETIADSACPTTQIEAEAPAITQPLRTAIPPTKKPGKQPKGLPQAGTELPSLSTPQQFSLF